MEMKFYKSIGLNLVFGLNLILALGLSGCASVGGDKPSEDSNVTGKSKSLKEAKGNKTASAVAVEKILAMPTTQYIPKQSTNEAGFPVPYASMTNPYLTNKRVIEQTSVLLFIKARRAFKANKLAEAATVLTELTKKDASLAGPWVMLGKIALRKEKYKKAESSFSKALKINKDNVNAYIGLATAQRWLGKYVLAQNTYANALAVWKDFPEAHHNLAVVYDIYLNQPLKALQHMEAYQFLTKGRNKKANASLAELKQRTGVEKSFISVQAESKASENNVAASDR